MTGLVEYAASLIPESEISRRRAVLAMTMTGPGDDGYEGIRSPSPRTNPQLTGRMLLDMADTVVLTVKCQTMHKIKLEVPREVWTEQLIDQLKEKYHLPAAAKVRAVFRGKQLENGHRFSEYATDALLNPGREGGPVPAELYFYQVDEYAAATQ